MLNRGGLIEGYAKCSPNNKKEMDRNGRTPGGEITDEECVT